MDGNFVNYVAVSKSIQRHIVECNPDIVFDFFIHCWSVELEESLVKLYNPKLWKFEDNRQYNEEIRRGILAPCNFGQLSSVLSMKKSIELMEDSGIHYDRVILFRPDVLIWKDMLLNEYDQNYIYVNNWIDNLGDFHFVMSKSNSQLFKRLYETASLDNPCFGEGWIRRFIKEYIRSDSICAGQHEEVLRQLKLVSVLRHKISPSFFQRYGLTLAEIDEYTIHS